VAKAGDVLVVVTDVLIMVHALMRHNLAADGKMRHGDSNACGAKPAEDSDVPWCSDGCGFPVDAALGRIICNLLASGSSSSVAVLQTHHQG
jgi:hypothetical protein